MMGSFIKLLESYVAIYVPPTLSAAVQKVNAEYKATWVVPVLCVDEVRAVGVVAVTSLRRKYLSATSPPPSRHHNGRDSSANRLLFITLHPLLFVLPRSQSKPRQRPIKGRSSTAENSSHCGSSTGHPHSLCKVLLAALLSSAPI